MSKEPLTEEELDEMFGFEPLTGAQLIAKERVRQVKEEGWSAEHDDEHEKGELVKAAASYLLRRCDSSLRIDEGYQVFDLADILWPWDFDYFKPTDPIKDLIKAGALIAAEIDRLLRKEKK